MELSLAQRKLSSQSHSDAGQTVSSQLIYFSLTTLLTISLLKNIPSTAVLLSYGFQLNFSTNFSFHHAPLFRPHHFPCSLHSYKTKFGEWHKSWSSSSCSILHSSNTFSHWGPNILLRICLKSSNLPLQKRLCSTHKKKGKVIPVRAMRAHKQSTNECLTSRLNRFTTGNVIGLNVLHQPGFGPQTAQPIA
jgi:hypothetical protein